jgi:chemotaxis protein methyltransferase CheR
MTELDDHQFEQFAKLARSTAGLDFPNSKRRLLAGRLQRRLRAVGATDFDQYLRLVQTEPPAHPDEQAQFISVLTTNVTGLFRESHHFELLAEEIARLRAQEARHRPIRIWSAGCATGEEPVSIAACCAAALGREWREAVAIDATDIDVNVLKVARRYRPDSLRLVERLQKLLGRAVDHDAFESAALGAAINYSAHNLLDGWPHRYRYDIVFCRNVLIYFDTENQMRARKVLGEAVAPMGMLMLGHSEKLAGTDRSARLVGPTCYRMNGFRKGEG